MGREERNKGKRGGIIVRREMSEGKRRKHGEMKAE